MLYEYLQILRRYSTRSVTIFVGEVESKSKYKNHGVVGLVLALKQ